MRRAGALTAWAAIALAGGCEQARTELVVVVDSEVAWGLGRTVQSVVISVRRGGATGPLRSDRTTALGEGGGQLPMLVGVIETLGDTDTPVWIEALGCGDPNGCTAETAVVAQRAVVRFVAGQTLELPLLLASACVGVACASDQRCATDMGQCEPATRAQEMVRPFTGPVDAADDDAGVEDVAEDGAIVVDSLLEIGTTDAEAMDSGAEETGATDVAASEAGPSDVGRVDVGNVDAGNVDAGNVDARVVDAGNVDAGVVDAGPVDAGPVDTGPVDAGRTIMCPSFPFSTRTCRGDDACCLSLGGLAAGCGVLVPIFGCLSN
jgi:hypothetical protein